MKYLILVLTILILSACESEPVIDAKYLALNDCNYTGKSFESLDRIWVTVGRGGHTEEVLNRWYVYECKPGNKLTLSLVRLVLESE